MRDFLLALGVVVSFGPPVAFIGTLSRLLSTKQGFRLYGWTMVVTQGLWVALFGWAWQVALCTILGLLAFIISFFMDDDDGPKRMRERLAAKVRFRVFGPGFVPAPLRT